MKIIELPGKAYSWLQWPVTLKSLTQESECLQAHLTAKFFGRAKIDVNYVLEKVRPYDAFLDSQWVAWNPVMFSNITYVLKLTTMPTTISYVHALFGLIEDQFKPYQAHITVPQLYWELVKKKKLTPQDVNLQFGELELCLGTEDDDADL